MGEPRVPRAAPSRRSPPAGPSGRTSPGCGAGVQGTGASGGALDLPAAGELSRRCPANGGIAGSARRPERANFVQPGLAFVGSLGKCGQGAGRQEARDRVVDTLKPHAVRAPSLGRCPRNCPLAGRFRSPLLRALR